MYILSQYRYTYIHAHTYREEMRRLKRNISKMSNTVYFQMMQFDIFLLEPFSF
jgi:hypothetical protein